MIFNSAFQTWMGIRITWGYSARRIMIQYDGGAGGGWKSNMGAWSGRWEFMRLYVYVDDTWQLRIYLSSSQVTLVLQLLGPHFETISAYIEMDIRTVRLRFNASGCYMDQAIIVLIPCWWQMSHSFWRCLSIIWFQKWPLLMGPHPVVFLMVFSCQLVSNSIYVHA